MLLYIPVPGNAEKRSGPFSEVLKDYREIKQAVIIHHSKWNNKVLQVPMIRVVKPVLESQ